MLTEALFNSWVRKEKRASIVGKRRYLHFDPIINFYRNISFFKSYFSKSENVANHSFYPFIKSSIITPKYKKVKKERGYKGYEREMTTKERPIMYAAHFDSFIYSYYSTILTAKYEEKLKKWGIYDCVLAYLEKGLSNIEYANEVFVTIKQRGECVAIALDIKSFYDNLDHQLLKKMWGRVINRYHLPKNHFRVYKSLTDFSYVEKYAIDKEFPEIEINRKYGIKSERICNPESFRKRIRGKNYILKNPNRNNITGSTRYGKICGIPQGSPISACLSNIYMIEFDIEVKKKMDGIGALYKRYSDDIIIVTESKYVDDIIDYLNSCILNIELQFNSDKTEITYFKKDALESNLRSYDENLKLTNLQYLGFEFNGQNIYIRSSSMSRFYQRLSARIRENLKAAYGHNSIGNNVFKKRLYNRYTEKGKRNFHTYARRSASIMNSFTIRKQYKKMARKVLSRFEKKKLIYEDKHRPKRRLK